MIVLKVEILKRKILGVLRKLESFSNLHFPVVDRINVFPQISALMAWKGNLV